LCADSNALKAAASSNVGCGGGGKGFFTGGGIIFAVIRRTGLVTFVAVFLLGDFACVFATDFATTFLAANFFAAVCLSALCARAFPAGERLVAGLRVDFTTRFRTGVAFDPDRDVERDASLFCVLATGLLMLTDWIT
jgi:hypothetical protein